MDADEADFYDSHGNEPPCVKDNEFDQYEDSIDELLRGQNSEITSSSKFVFLSNEQMVTFNIDPSSSKYI